MLIPLLEKDKISAFDPQLVLIEENFASRNPQIFFTFNLVPNILLGFYVINKMF